MSFVAPRWMGCVLVLAAGVLVTSPSAAQSSDARSDASRRRGTLEANQPNPFSVATTIPFRVGDHSCDVTGEHYLVTLRIYNILSQVVAIPTLVDSVAADDSTAAAPPPSAVSDLTLSCGSYAAYWDGKQSRSGEAAPAGVYMYQLVVDGRPAGMRKMVLARP